MVNVDPMGSEEICKSMKQLLTDDTADNLVLVFSSNMYVHSYSSIHTIA
jgi:hypothetical protein